MDYDQLLEGCSQVGFHMLSGGAEIYRVEDTVRRIMAAYGVKGDIFALPNSVTVSLTDEDGRSYTRMCRINTMPSTDIEVIERFNALSRAVCARTPAPEQLPALVEETGRQCRNYSARTVLLGYFIGAFFFTLFFNGGILEALAASAAGVLAGLCVMGLDRQKVNFFFKTVIAALVLGIVAYGLRALGLPINADITVVGALMVLVPGLIFTNFMCDLITGDLLSGVSAFIRATLTAAAMAIGAGAAMTLFQKLGASLEPAGQSVAYSAAAQCVIGFLACFGFCLLYNVHGWCGMFLCCLGGALGWGVYLATEAFIGDFYLRYLAATVCIAVYAEVMARWRKYPITAYLVVSFFPLIPGYYIYYTMYYGIQREQELFLTSGIRALGIAACLAMGSLLVSTTVRTYTTWQRERRARKNGTL